MEKRTYRPKTKKDYTNTETRALKRYRARVLNQEDLRWLDGQDRLNNNKPN